jgi:hypothetical protein
MITGPASMFWADSTIPVSQTARVLHFSGRRISNSHSGFGYFAAAFRATALSGAWPRIANHADPRAALRPTTTETGQLPGQ